MDEASPDQLGFPTQEQPEVTAHKNAIQTSGGEALEQPPHTSRLHLMGFTTVNLARCSTNPPNRLSASGGLHVHRGKASAQRIMNPRMRGGTKPRCCTFFRIHAHGLSTRIELKALPRSSPWPYLACTKWSLLLSDELTVSRAIPCRTHAGLLVIRAG